MLLGRFILAFAAVLTLSLSMPIMAAENTSASDSIGTSSVHQDVVKVNLNTATAEQLGKLKGIGASKAQAILNYRTQHGPFKSVEDLTHVKGFSNKTVATLMAKNPGAIVIE